MARWSHCSRSVDRRTGTAIATSSWSASSAPWWRWSPSLRSARWWGRSESSLDVAPSAGAFRCELPHGKPNGPTFAYGPCEQMHLERCSQAPQASIQGIIMSVDVKTATDRLMRFLAVEGVTGREAAIGRDLSAALQASGVPADAIRLDDANTRIPVP